MTTISVPVFDEHDKVKYIVQSVRDDQSFLYKELSPIKNKDETTASGKEMVYKSQVMGDLLTDTRKLAPTMAPVLILGETGTGKTHLARYIHNHSDRKMAKALKVSQTTANRLIDKYVKTRDGETDMSFDPVPR